MAKLIYEVIVEAGKKRSKAEKVECLKQNESWALKDVIKGSMDSKIKWKLPGGTPPYNPSEAHNHPATLHREHKNFVYFVSGQRQCETLPAYKREKIFQRMCI